MYSALRAGGRHGKLIDVAKAVTPVGSLETPHVSFLYNLNHVRQIERALLKQLTMLFDLVESAETLYLCSILSDAEKYMVATGEILKYLYPKLFHVACVAHTLHNRATQVKSLFEDVD